MVYNTFCVLQSKTKGELITEDSSIFSGKPHPPTRSIAEPLYFRCLRVPMSSAPPRWRGRQAPEVDFCENLAPKICTPPLFPRLLSVISRKFRAAQAPNTAKLHPRKSVSLTSSRKFRAAPETAKLHPRKSVSLRNLRKFRGARAPNTAKLHPRKSVYLTSRRKFQNIHRCTETSPTRLCGPTNIPNHPRPPGNVGQWPTFPGRCRILDAFPKL